MLHGYLVFEENKDSPFHPKPLLHIYKTPEKSDKIVKTETDWFTTYRMSSTYFAVARILLLNLPHRKKKTLLFIRRVTVDTLGNLSIFEDNETVSQETYTYQDMKDLFFLSN
jgi:hypothetical protein